MINKLVLFAIAVAVVGFYNDAFSQENHIISMATLDADISASSLIENEAGISAYGQLNYVDLDIAENAFKYIEQKTDSYIIGTVSLPGYGENHDVHVYLDSSMWIIAYYLGEEEPGKIIDWVDYYSTGTMSGTKLETALNIVVGEMGAYLSDLSYYDFRFPNATNIAIITDEEDVSGSTETFRFMVPNNHFLHSKTWSHAAYKGRGSTCKLKIDDSLLHEGASSSGWSINEGEIPGNFLIYNTFHTISIIHYDNIGSARSFGAVILIYSLI